MEPDKPPSCKQARKDAEPRRLMNRPVLGPRLRTLAVEDGGQLVIRSLLGAIHPKPLNPKQEYRGLNNLGYIIP